MSSPFALGRRGRHDLTPPDGALADRWWRSRSAPAAWHWPIDPTTLPRDGDTGWATVHHLAATVLGEYARALDGIAIEKRGLRDYSFYDEGGVGELTRRRAVHTNWLRWWQERPEGKRSRWAQ